MACTTHLTPPRRSRAPLAQRGRELGRRALPEVRTHRSQRVCASAATPSTASSWSSARALWMVRAWICSRFAIGSEGLLMVVTEVTVRLIPRPQLARLVMASFDDVAKAAEAVAAIIAAGIIPAASK